MKNQFEVFSAVLNNFDTAIQATETAENSQGSAMEENARQSESLQAKIQELKAQFQEFVLGDGGLAKFIKLLIEAGTAILKFANSDIGQTIIKVTAFTTTLILLDKGFNLLKGNISSSIQNFIAYQSALVASNASTTAMYSSTQLLTGGLLTLAKAWLASPFGQVTLAVGGFVAVIKILDNFVESTAEAKEAIKSLNQEYQESTDNIEKISEQLKEKFQAINEINNLSQNEQNQKSGELQQLILETAELQTQLEIEKERQRIAQEQLEEKAKKTVYASEQTEKIGAGQYVSKDRLQLVEEYSGKIRELNSDINELVNEQNKLIESNNQSSDAFRSNAEELNSLKGKRDELSQEALKYVDDLKEETSQLNDNSDTKKDVEKVTNDYVDAINNMNDSLENNSDTLSDNSAYQEDVAVSVDEANQAFQDAVAQVGELDDAYSTLSSAVDDYNQNGYFSLDSLEQLMSLGDEYLSLLQFENGQLSINEEGLYALANARIDEAETTAIESAQADLLALAMGNASDETVNAGNASANSTTGFDAATQSIVNLGIEAVNSSNSLVALFNALSAGNAKQGDFNSEAKKITQSLANQIYAFENVRANIGKSVVATNNHTRATKGNTGAHKRNTGARKKNTSATKAQTSALKAQKKALEDEADALEKQIKEYEIVIDYVKDLLKEEQEAVENQKDKELQAIKDKMDALEDEQEAFENNIEIQINLLEKQRDEQEKYWDEQINGIKDANKELEDNIKLQQLQEALAYARTQKVKVLKGGEFVYVEDTEAISKAEQELADYEQQLAVQRQIEELERLKEEALNSLDKQVEDLENYRDRTKDNYDQQLKDLQDHYDKVEQEYDYRIAQYDAWLKQFEDMLNASARRHAQILYNELVGEQGNWDARIKALGKFVNDYDYKKKQLDGIKNQINAITNQISGLEAQARSAQANVGRIRSGVANDIASINRMKDSAQLKYIGYVTGRTGANLHHTDSFLSSQMAQEQAELWIKHYGNSYWASQGPLEVSVASHYNQGTYSVAEDQIAVVGDPTNPNNRELAVGARINRGDGILTKLQKGTGIIPHGHTLTENLIGLARWSQNGGLERVINNQNSNSSSIINIGTINLPQVQNGEDFVSYLESNFLNDSIQFSNIRR